MGSDHKFESGLRAREGVLMDIRVKTDGPLHLVTRLEKAYGDLSPVLADIAEDFKETVAPDTFNHHGPGWAPLSPRYAAWKSRVYPGRPLMVVSGRLRNSLFGETNEWFQRISRYNLDMGTTVPYATYHQTGTRFMPARPVINVTRDDERVWTKMIARYLVEQVVAS